MAIERTPADVEQTHKFLDVVAANERWQDVERHLARQPAPTEPQFYMGVPIEQFSREALIKIVYQAAMGVKVEQEAHEHTLSMFQTVGGRLADKVDTFGPKYGIGSGKKWKHGFFAGDEVYEVTEFPRPSMRYEDQPPYDVLSPFPEGPMPSDAECEQ